ncbi:MAG: hypothetical protein ACMUJM_15720 [bacterium]
MYKGNRKKFYSLIIILLILFVLLVISFSFQDIYSQYSINPSLYTYSLAGNKLAENILTYFLYPPYINPAVDTQFSFLERLLLGEQLFALSPLGSVNYLPEALFYSPLVDSPLVNLRFTNASVNLVLAQPPKGMYCWDPIGWLEGGFQVNLWKSSLTVRAQSFDKKGLLLDIVPEFIVDTTGEIGIMTLLDPDILLFEGSFFGGAPNDYLTTVTVGTASTVAITHRRSATCDACHPTPPGHVAFRYTWGRCHDCHKLDSVLHKHALQDARLPIDDCYRCHPSGCLSGVHGRIGIWCTDCHGTLLDAVNDRMLISGQLGLPYCASCHGPLYAENLPRLFKDSRGHGGVWCINCHAPTHIENPIPLGYGDCGVCHTVQAADPSMGPDCGICHGSSISPHLVYY